MDDIESGCMNIGVEQANIRGVVHMVNPSQFLSNIL